MRLGKTSAKKVLASPSKKTVVTRTNLRPSRSPSAPKTRIAAQKKAEARL
jgi:hypothetical protein